jgi:hypothetical protein
LDQFARGLLTGEGLLDRLAFIKQCAGERARREHWGLDDTPLKQTEDGSEYPGPEDAA